MRRWLGVRLLRLAVRIGWPGLSIADEDGLVIRQIGFAKGHYPNFCIGLYDTRER